MIVEKSETGANHHFAVATWIPGNAQARRKIFGITRNSFDYTQGLFGCGVNGGSGGKKRRAPIVVAQAVIYGEMFVRAPAVLNEKCINVIVEGLIGSSDSLNVRGGYPQAIGLQAGGARKSDGLTVAERHRVGESKAVGREAAEVYVAAKIKRENLRFGGTQLDDVEVPAHFEGVPAANQRQVIGEFRAALDAIDGGIWFAAEICVARNVDADVGAAGQLRKSEVQAATCKLAAKLIEGGVADGGVVLSNDGEIAILIYARAGSGVLSEDLILRGGLHAGNQRWGDADTQEGSVVIVPALGETRGPQTGFVGDREITAKRVEPHEGSGQRGKALANQGTIDGVHGLTRWATHWERKLRAWPGIQKSFGESRGDRAEIQAV